MGYIFLIFGSLIALNFGFVDQAYKGVVKEQAAEQQVDVEEVDHAELND